MADAQNPNDPSWDWLFQGGAAADPEAARTAPTADGNGPDATPGDRPPVTSFGGTYPRRTTSPTPGAAPESTRRLPDRPVATAAPAPATYGPVAAPPRRTGSGVPPRGPETGRVPAAATVPPRRRRRIRWVRIVVAALVAWLVFLAVVPAYAWSRVHKVDAEPAGHRPAGGPGTTYLLVGSDSREGLTDAQKKDLGTGSASGQRTDTIIVLHVSDHGPNVMLSIPRDSYVSVPGHGMQKINAAYAYGGPKLLVRTVEQSTGIRIDDYVEIGFTGVVDVVDAVGGITVCPKTPVHDPLAGHLNMRRGCQEVDGHTALDYSRSRAFPLGDITRTLHQREVIAATGKAAASWQTIALPWRYWRVNMAGADSVTVGDNVGPLAFARFAWAMAHSSGSGTLRCVVPFSSLGTSTSVGSVVTWDKPKAAAIFSAINDDETSDIKCNAG